jgi:sialate O-acetylesterase
LADVLVLDFTVRPSGRHLLVTEGLEPFKVYQRGEDGKATLSFSGLASGAGEIEARLLAGRRVVEGFDWRKVGRSEGGKFGGSLAGVPAGGEYEVEIRRRDAVGNVAEVTAVENVLVGDVWLLAGQSNMEGYGNLAALEEPSSRIHSFTMAHRWELAVEPLHWLSDSRDPVHLGDRFQGLDEEGRQLQRSRLRRERKKGAGLALPFAKHLLEHTGIPIGLIPAAHGGTSMTQWDPAQKEGGGESLYGSLLKQARRAGGKVKGVLWYQGESDANPEAAGLFRERFSKLIAALREDLASPRLPFYYVQIGRYVVDGRDPGPWKTVQEAQRIAAGEIPGTAVAASLDLPLDDAIHVSTGGLKRLGERLAKIARREIFGEERLQVGPTLAGARLEEEGAAVRVLFSNVNDRLEPAGRVSGFSVRGTDGKERSMIFNAAVDPAHPHTVLLKLSGKWPAGATLWYGTGLDPFANLTDSEDLAAPAFGPLDLKEPRP